MSFDKSNQIWESCGKYVLPTNSVYFQPVLKRGKGSFVWDVNGKRYLDLNCGQFCCALGTPISRSVQP